VGSTETIQQLTNLQSWWRQLPDTPLYDYWRAALLLLTLIAAVVVVVVLVLLALDQGEVRTFTGKRRRDKDRRASDDLPNQRPEGEEPAQNADALRGDLGRGRGVLSRWCAVLQSLRDEHHAADPETLEHMLEGRYGWSETWLSGLRTTATLTGLFFTFLGLAFTLEDLSSALQLPDEGTADQVKQAVDNVRGALPGLGTAFASSIFGVGLAIVIGLVDAGLRTWRDRLGSRMTLLSAEWLRPLFVLPRGEEAVLRLMEAQERTFKAGLQGLGTTLATLHAEADARNQELLQAILVTQLKAANLADNSKQVITTLAGVADQLQKLPATTTQAWTGILAGQKEQHVGLLADQKQQHATLLADQKEQHVALLSDQKTQQDTLRADQVKQHATLMSDQWEQHTAIMAGQKERHDVVMADIDRATREASEQLEAALTSARTAVEADLVDMREAVTEGTTALKHAIDDVRQEGERILVRMSDVSDSLTSNAESFGVVASNAATALDLSADQIGALREASDRFRSALVRVEEIAETGAATKARELQEMNRAFGTIGQMAEAVTESAATSAEAAKRLQAVLGGKDMVRYLEQLPHLAELAEREREAREAMDKAVKTFTRVASAVQTLDQHTERIGQTSAMMRVAHERLMASHAALSQSMANLVQGEVLPVVQEVVNATVEGVSQRAETAWQTRYAGILLQHERQLSDLAAASARLDRTEQELIKWLRSSTWSRLFGRT